MVTSRLVRELRSRVKYLRALSFIVLGVALLLCLSASFLQAGLWEWTEELHRPFHLEGLAPSTYLVPVGIKGRFRTIFKEVSDDAGTSDLRLWVNGEEWGPGHAPHTVVRAGSTHAFSHWNGNVYFCLSPDIANDRSVDLRVTYSARVRPALLFVLSLATVTLLALHLTVFGAPRILISSGHRLAPLPLYAFLLGGRIAIAASIFYGATIVYGVLFDYALPTAAIFDLIPVTRSLALVEPYAPIAILIVAAVGASANWLAHFSILPRLVVRRAEVTQLRLWRRWGVMCFAALMIFSVSSAGWNGLIRSSDTGYSLAGLVPNSDAANYFTSVSDQIQFGTWSDMGSRRPLAEAFRQLTAFVARYSYAGILLLQSFLTALLVTVAASQIASWRGFWASAAFVGLSYMLARAYLYTTMSEPLGLLWGLACVIFLIEALRRRSRSHALVALLALALGLWTRMGAMFVLPAMVLWIAFVYATGASARLRLLLAGSVTVLAVFALNTLLAFLYDKEGTATGANFGFTVCGLALGGDWSLCYKTYAAAFDTLNEGLQARFAFQKAWEAFSQHPELALRMLLHNASEFLVGSPSLYLTGMNAANRSESLYAALALAPGVLYALISRSLWIERSFWLMLWVAVILSAAIVFGDGGWRGLYVTNAVLAVFVAFGFSTPTDVLAPSRNRWIQRPRNGALLVAMMGGLFVIVPMLAQTFDRIALPPAAAAAAKSERLVAGGRWPTGFIVLADNAVRPTALPSMRYSTFADMIRRVALEAETGPFLDDVTARVPFAFMTTPDIDHRGSTAIYIAPLELLSRRDVKVWRLAVAPVRQRSILMIVDRAEPLAVR